MDLLTISEVSSIIIMAAGRRSAEEGAENYILIHKQRATLDLG